MTTYPQFCALARAAEIVGERWSLLILRELMLGPKRFTDLRQRLAPVTPSVLSSRLRRLADARLIERVRIEEPIPGHVFRLTSTGEALRPAMFELIRWGARFLFPARDGETFEPDWLRLVFEAYAATEATPAIVVGFVVAGNEAHEPICVQGGPTGSVVLGEASAAQAVITAEPAALLAIMSGHDPVDAALDAGRITVAGDIEAARRVPLLFRA